MTGDDAAFIDTVEIRGHTETGRELRRVVRIPEISAGEFAVIDGALDVTLTIDALTEQIEVHGVVSGRWRGPCRRCLDEIDGLLEVEIQEIFEPRPTEGETWPLTDDGIDLTPLLRETALLALPLAPLCGDGCEGPEPERFPTGALDEKAQPSADPRWAVLDELTFGERQPMRE